MDLIKAEMKESVFDKRRKEILERSGERKVICLPTSMYEISLYKAWNEIISNLIVDMDKLKAALATLTEACQAEEVILFEKSTFLMTCHYSAKTFNDDQRFERISENLKMFKLSCMKTNSRINYHSMSIKTKCFAAYLAEFTSNTYVMIVLNEKSANLGLISLNIKLSRSAFENIIISQ
jgi:Ras-related GTP-binding protein A/B